MPRSSDARPLAIDSERKAALDVETPVPVESPHRRSFCQADGKGKWEARTWVGGERAVV
jgi:hypothetical protein